MHINEVSLHLIDGSCEQQILTKLHQLTGDHEILLFGMPIGHPDWLKKICYNKVYFCAKNKQKYEVRGDPLIGTDLFTI